MTRPTKNAMRLTFLGTRGEIDARTRRHRMHTSLLVSYRAANVMIDCGLDWLGKLKRVSPQRNRLNARASRSRLGIETWRALSGVCAAKNVERIESLPDQRSPRDQRANPNENLWDHVRSLRSRTFRSFSDGRLSRKCRARARIFYAPDLIFIHERSAALKDVQLYIGDGATVTQSFIRKRGKALIGHSPVRTQLTWCQKEGVPRAIITHCGSEIVTGDEREISAKINAMAAELRVDVRIAYDGMKLKL